MALLTTHHQALWSPNRCVFSNHLNSLRILHDVGNSGYVHFGPQQLPFYCIFSMSLHHRVLLTKVLHEYNAYLAKACMHMHN